MSLSSWHINLDPILPGVTLMESLSRLSWLLDALTLDIQVRIKKINTCQNWLCDFRKFLSNDVRWLRPLKKIMIISMALMMV